MSKTQIITEILSPIGKQIGYALKDLSKANPGKYIYKTADGNSSILKSPFAKLLSRKNIGTQRIIPVDGTIYKSEARNLLNHPIVQRNIATKQKQFNNIAEEYRKAADRMAAGDIVNANGVPLKFATRGTQEIIEPELVLSGMTSDAPLVLMASRGVGANNPFFKLTANEGGLISHAADKLEAANYAAFNPTIIKELLHNDPKALKAINIIEELERSKNIKAFNPKVISSAKYKFNTDPNLTKEQKAQITPAMIVGKFGVFERPGKDGIKEFVPWTVDEYKAYAKAQDYITQQLHNRGIFDQGGLFNALIDPRDFAKVDARGQHYSALNSYNLQSSKLFGKLGSKKLNEIAWAGPNSVESKLDDIDNLRGVIAMNLYNPNPMTYIGSRPGNILGYMKKGGKFKNNKKWKPKQ